MTWKDDKNLGPWAFTKQPNKWGYLNNPRWQPIARAFTRGGPDDYDGRESLEPQIFSGPDRSIPQSVDSQKIHHQCGHWHQPIPVSLPMPTGYPCAGDPQYIMHLGTLPAFTSGLCTLNEVGLYYDIGHTQLVPGTLVTLPNNTNNGSPEFWFWILVPPAAYNVPMWRFIHSIVSGVETWVSGGGSGIVLSTLYDGVWPSQTLNEVYFTGIVKWNNIKDDYPSHTAVPVIAEDRFDFNPWLTDPYWTLQGYSVASIGLYYGNPNTYGVDPYTLIPGTIVSQSPWDISIDPNLLPYPPTSNVSDRYWIYLGITFNDVAEIVYVPYARVSEPHPMVYFRWMGEFGGADCFKVCVYVINELDSFLVCAVPSITFIATPTSIGFGGSSILSWAITGALSASIDNGIGAVSYLNGIIVVSPLVNTTYTLTASGLGGTSSDSATVSLPAPTAVISADPLTIAPGESSLLIWSTTNATSVSINNGIGVVAASGSLSISPGATATYTITATGPGGTATDSVGVVVSSGIVFAPSWVYWKLEEDTGPRTDASGNARDATDAPSGGLDPIHNSPSKLGNGALFDGNSVNGQELSLVNQTPNLSGNAHFMFCWWQKHTVISLPDYCNLFFNLANGLGGNTGSYGGDPDKAFFMVSAGSLDIDAENYILTPDVDHFICVYYNGTGLYLEIDNVLIASALGTHGISSHSGSMWIGDVYEGGQMSFVIGDINFYLGSDADDAIVNRADLWNSGNGMRPY